MSKTTYYHFYIDIRGVLSWPKKQLKGLITKDNGMPASADEVVNYLYDRLSEGKRVLPLHDCDNFCYQKGCLGHSEPPAK